jgi:hypothetical protein
MDLRGLDVTTAWEELSGDTRKAILDELKTRLEAVGEGEWTQYEASSCELDLTAEWWRKGDWRAYQELLQRASQAVGTTLRPGDIVEVEDVFLVLTAEAVWRPLLPSRFVAQLHHIGRGSEPPPLRDRPPEVIPSPSTEADGRHWPAPQIKLQVLVLDAVKNAQPHYERLLDSLPSHHQAHARAVVEEFLDNDLKKGLGRCDVSTETGKVRALRRLLSLAVEREAIVTITYRQDVLSSGLAKHRELRRAMVRIWDDEVYHEVYFRAVRTGSLRPRLDRITGRIGGRAAATLSDEGARRLRRLRAGLVKLGGRVSGKLGRETAGGMRPLPPPAYCAHNVALEVTACLAYEVMAALLLALPGIPKPVLMDPALLAWKVSQISGQELEHAQMFRDICVLLEGKADTPTRGRLDQATRIVRSGVEWRSARGAATTPPAECAARSSGIPPSVLEAVLDPQEQRLESLERELRASRTPSICIQSPVDVRRALSDPAWADVEAVVTWIARWCATRSVEGTIYIVDGKPTRLDERQALTVATNALGDPEVRLANVAQLTTHKIPAVYLTAQGGFYSSDPDILHKVWWGWAEAQLRVAVTASPDDVGFLVENLRALILPVFDVWLGHRIDPNVAWREVSGLADVAALRLLGGYPPDLALARVRRRGSAVGFRRRIKDDVLVVAPDALAVDRRAAELTSTDLQTRELYAIAALLDD